MGSNYFGEPNLGNERGSGSSSSSRKSSRKNNSDKPKQPQRGLGVAQLEKIRLHGQAQMGCATYHPSLHGPYPTNFNNVIIIYFSLCLIALTSIYGCLVRFIGSVEFSFMGFWFFIFGFDHAGGYENANTSLFINTIIIFFLFIFIIIIFSFLWFPPQHHGMRNVFRHSYKRGCYVCSYNFIFILYFTDGISYIHTYTYIHIFDIFHLSPFSDYSCIVNLCK